ncbi:DNA repair protein RecO [Candidatus Saccharibacteria bacterium]|nr:DNA repair protein RecO [Candidatus Saccharibacteria bacterium]MBI3338279.1 DNA repair protein RecO [Candidatus Saccharibacteria bacterium]
MKSQIITTGIMLARTDFQEADRIITVLTSDHGKIRAIAKGVRRPKSRLAGGIELFSVSNLTFLPGRGEMQTLISSRLGIHYGNIVNDINKTMLGYELLKIMNRLTEDAAGGEYFYLLQTALDGLNNQELLAGTLELWFDMHLLKITGHAPNLQTDKEGNKLKDNQRYVFSFDDMLFVPIQNGLHDTSVIKLLRLAYAAKEPSLLARVNGVEALLPKCQQLTKTMLNRFVRI